MPLDQNVTVSRQVLAEPDMDLPDKVWASLADGTPLVTAKRQGKGLIVLFHVTANADWSNLPLSGLFVEMLRRINDLAPGAGGGAAAGASSSDDRATAFIPRLALSAAGELIEPLPDSKPISPADIEKAKPTPETPAGLYNRASAERAINLLPDAQAMTAITTLPNGVTLRSFATPPRQPLAPLLFTARVSVVPWRYLGRPFPRRRLAPAARHDRGPSHFARHSQRPRHGPSGR